LPTNFLPQRSRRPFLVCTSKRVSCVFVFFCKGWAPFFRIKQCWAPFLPAFSKILPRFSGILPRFSGILPRFPRLLPRFPTNQNFCGCVCTPCTAAAYTTAPNHQFSAYMISQWTATTWEMHDLGLSLWACADGVKTEILLDIDTRHCSRLVHETNIQGHKMQSLAPSVRAISHDVTRLIDLWRFTYSKFVSF